MSDIEWLPSLSRLDGGDRGMGLRLREEARVRIRAGEYVRRRGDLVRDLRGDLEREYRRSGGERERWRKGDLDRDGRRGGDLEERRGDLDGLR